MAFPNEKEIAKLRKKLAKAKGTLMPPVNPTPLERLRWDICQAFVKYVFENELKSVELAKRLKLHESEVSRILHHRIDRFSTDKLLVLLEKILPDHEVLLKVA